MFVTDISMGFVIAWVWKFHWTVAVVGCLPFIFVDGLFLTLNFTKLSEGASSFTSIIIALVAWFCMQAHWYTKTSLNKVAHVTQRNARVVGKVNGRLKDDGDNDPLRTDLMSTATTAEVDYLLRLLKESKALKRTPVAGVFMRSAPQAPPSSLTVLARSMAALPETIILLHISFSCVRPFVDEHERYDLHCHSEELGVYSLNMYFGYIVNHLARKILTRITRSWRYLSSRATMPCGNKQNLITIMANQEIPHFLHLLMKVRTIAIPGLLFLEPNPTRCDGKRHRQTLCAHN